MIAGNRRGDQKHEIRLDEIKATNYETGNSLRSRISRNLFALETEGAHYTIPLSNDYGVTALEELTVYLQETHGAIAGGVAVDSDEAGYTIAGNDSIEYSEADVRSRLDRVPDAAMDEANELLAKTNDPETLVPQLNRLIEREEQSSRSLDEMVSEASSVEELRRELETPAERAQRRAKERAEKGFEQARETFKQSDPEEVGKWGVSVGQAALPLARVAPGSTPLWLAAYFVLGGAAGVHASGSKASPLAEIDPEALAAHVTALAQAGKGLENIDGEVTGTLLGAFTHLGTQLAPEEYAKWIVAADPEAILAGAEAGAEFAMSDDVTGSRRQGAVAGAGLGALGSYTTNSDSDAFREILDADLYEQYLKEIASENTRALETSTE
ncbi:hypothetical protein [Natronosalvus halobius]|uniref:hypothetical protein n=1 Tax=Natronosalvus halobius TaxID=2953746 RepID=UPI00209F4DBC|nr:hypothetical protein [Natronosalvus halobius]USZ70514.1 hypothetical protein NGM15_10360 [Natronosalvus halobius]